MSEDESIVAKIDPDFIELMIQELDGQSRSASRQDSSSTETDEEDSEPDTVDDVFHPPPDDRPLPPLDDATPVDPHPALDEDLEATPPPTERRGKRSKGEVVRLEIVEPKHRERVFRLHRKPIVIGRSREADISLRDNKTSRQHIRIELVENRIMVTDLSSQNGTRVNDRLIREREVISGDVIAIGRTTIRVRRVKE